MATLTQKVTPSIAYGLLKKALSANLVPFMRSSPGVGKSSLVKQLAREHNLMLLDIRLSTCAPEDLNGLPFFQNGSASFIPFDFWPLASRYKEDGSDFPINPLTITKENPEGVRYAGFLIFCDEFNQAPKSVQAAAYRLILDRQIGLHDLHSKVYMMAAGNLLSDRAHATDVGTALQSRMVHLELEVSFDDWMTNVAMPQKYDPRIVGYLNQYRTKLMDFNPKHEDLTFCCPRTWEFANRLLKNHPGNDLSELLPLLCGTLTSLVATELVQFSKIFNDIVPMSEILASPSTARIPNDKALQWATTMSMAEHVDTKNFEKFAEYAERLELPIRIVFLRQAIVRCPQIVGSPAFAKVMNIMAKYLNS